MKKFLLLVVLAIVGWLWATGKLPQLGRVSQTRGGFWGGAKQMELQPLSGSGAPESVRKLGQGVAGSYGQAAPKP